MFDSIIFLFVFSVIYLFIVEIFTVLFRLTGLTEEKARFQVISLLTACGFTTSKSEAITMTKKRRQLAAVTMIFGYIFSLIIVSVVVNVFMEMSASHINTFAGIGATFTGVFLVIFGLIKLKKAKLSFDALIDKIYIKLSRNRPDNLTIMDVIAGKIIANVPLDVLPAIFIDTQLKNSGLETEHDIQILAISRDGRYLESVNGNTKLQLHDDIIVFGNEHEIVKLFGKKA